MKIYKASTTRYFAKASITLFFIIFPGMVFYFLLSFEVSSENDISIMDFFNPNNFISSSINVSTTPCLIMLVALSSLMLPLLLYPMKVGLSEDRIDIGSWLFSRKPVYWDCINRIERIGQNKFILYHSNDEKKKIISLKLFTNNRANEIISFIDSKMKIKRG